MLTPFGYFSELKLNDIKTSYDILAFEKHQIAEGLVVESLFDQIIKKIPSCVEQEVSLLDVETFVTREKDFKTAHVFVWQRSSSTGLGRYLIALQKKFKVHLIKLDETLGFLVCSIKDGRRKGSWVEIETYMQDMGRSKDFVYEVDASVKSEARHLAAFWGYLKDIHGEDLKNSIALPRLLVNWGIYPWFGRVWNVDRVLLVGENVWILEVKHKYPYGEEPNLRFGLNNGEAYLLRDLASCGIKAAHLVLVKPYWDMKVSSSYLLSSFTAKESAVVVGIILSKELVANIIARPSETSGGHTVVSGRGKIQFKPIRVTEYSRLSLLSEPMMCAQKISELLSGNMTSDCTEEMLRSMQIPAKP